VEIPGLGINKINQANVEGGATLTARVVSRTLNNVAIDRYVRVNNSAVRELVDLMGGVEIYIPFPMQYKDVSQNLYIDLKPGWQTLNGSQVEQFARFRADGNGDIGRVQRQQVLLKALRQRLLNPTVLPRLPQILGVMQQYVDTNLSLEETMALGSFLLELTPETLHMVMLPGRFSQPQEYKTSYWLLNPGARDRVMKDYFQAETSQNTTKPAPEQRPQAIRIAIQNATGTPKAAEKFASYLSSKGFDNSYIIADWTEPITQTQIIAQQGDLDMGNKLQQFLGTGKLEASSTGDINSDFTIRLGRDWLDK
jgi:LCP family protein required for cell wall assembly